MSVRCLYICSVSDLQDIRCICVHSGLPVYINGYQTSRCSACGKLLIIPVGVLTVSYSGCFFFVVCFSLCLKLPLMVVVSSAMTITMTFMMASTSMGMAGAQVSM